MSVLPRNEVWPRLKLLEEEMARLEEEIRRLYPGVRVKWVRCGKPNCWCARRGPDQKGHGPYFYHYRWVPPQAGEEKGRQVEKYLGKELPGEEVKPAGWRKLRALAKRLTFLSREREELLGLVGSSIE